MREWETERDTWRGEREDRPHTFRLRLVTVSHIYTCQKDEKTFKTKERKKEQTEKQFAYVSAMYNTAGHRVRPGICQFFNSPTSEGQTFDEAAGDGGLYLPAPTSLNKEKKQSRDNLLSTENILWGSLLLICPGREMRQSVKEAKGR